jgi:phosphoribosylamine--glycine ligase
MVPLVSKPNGDVDRALSYVAKSPADMVYMLERWKRLDKHKGPFIMQDCIYGTEMAVGGWFGPHGFNEGWCENWEFKKLMNDDLGVATGEQGTVLRVVKKSKLADKVLAPMAEQLAKVGYVGYIDVNCIIDDEGNPWPLEFTMRPGWPTFNIQQQLHKGDHAEWLLNLAEGKDAKNWIYDEVALGVVLSIPDYPYSKFTRKEVVGVPIYGMTPAIASSVAFNQVMMGEAPQELDGKIVTLPAWLTAGDYVLVASGTGPSIKAAKSKAYSVLKKISLPNSPMYRTDIGNRLKKQLPVVQSLGYATKLNFQTPD